MEKSGFSGRNNEGEATSVDPKRPEDEGSRVDEDALQAADAFYNMFKSACHGITRRQELDQLYNATYLSFGSKHEQRPEFSKVLFAMARTMKVLRVVRGGTISWKAFDHQEDRRPRFDGNRDQRDDRRRDDRRDDRQDNHHRPRFEGARDQRDDRRSHGPRDDSHDRHRGYDRENDQRQFYGHRHYDQHQRRDFRDERRPHYDQRQHRDFRDDRRETDQVPSHQVRSTSVERQ